MDMALPTEQLVDLWRSAQTAVHGHKQALLKAGAQKLGVSLQTLYRELENAGLKKARKQRQDAGVVTLTRDEALEISTVLMAGFRANAKKLAGIEYALTLLRGENAAFACRLCEQTGELVPLSASACLRALREYQLHPDQLNRATPCVQQASLHPNHVWQIDASISTLFYVPEGGVADMSPAVFYKNKPGNFEKIKRQRLTRYVVTDHTSGAVFCWYVAGGESIANLGESLLEAMREKQGEALYGVPLKLYFDAGSAATKTFARFLQALDISPIVHAVGNPRATGQVENAHNLVETGFEVGFKFAHVPGIDWINEKARKWCKWFNASRVHGRHKMTRLDAWMRISAAQLRLVDVSLARELLTREPETAKVRDSLRIRFKNKIWNVEAVPGVTIGETLAITVNPLTPEQAWVVTYQEGVEVLHAIAQVEANEFGFELTAPVIGESFASPADTQLDKNRKEVQRHMYGATTDEEAASAAKARALPLGGRIDPYKHLEDLPDVAVLPRRGTALQGVQASRISETLLSHAQAALMLKKTLSDWSAKDYSALVRLYPEGVSESDLAAVAARLRMQAIGVRHAEA